MPSASANNQDRSTCLSLIPFSAQTLSSEVLPYFFQAGFDHDNVGAMHEHAGAPVEQPLSMLRMEGRTSPVLPGVSCGCGDLVECPFYQGMVELPGNSA